MIPVLLFRWETLRHSQGSLVKVLVFETHFKMMSREEVPVALPVLAAFPHAQLLGKTSFYQMTSTLAYLSCSGTGRCSV